MYVRSMGRTFRQINKHQSDHQNPSNNQALKKEHCETHPGRNLEKNVLASRLDRVRSKDLNMQTWGRGPSRSQNVC